MPFPTSAVLADAFVAMAADPLPPGGSDRYFRLWFGRPAQAHPFAGERAGGR